MASKRPWFDDGDPEAVIELTDIIDEGSSGAVFEGKINNERVAVKVIPGLDNKAIEDEIHEEIKILRKIAASNPYLVGFKGAWVKEEHAWIAMEICEGGSAIDLCQICQTTLKTDECAALCASVLLALKFLHEDLGVVHRDVKGKNILFTADGKVKLTDLGIAVVSPEKDPSSKPLPAGSPHWMAPELNSASLTCYANDIWSLGITLIELVEGEPPHSDIAPTEVLKVIESSPPPSFSESIKKTVGADLVSFLAACVTKDPAKRPTAAKLLRHPFVDAFVMHLFVSDKPEPTMQKLIQRALPIIHEYKLFERLRRLELAADEERNAAEAQAASSSEAKVPVKWSEADGDLVVLDDETEKKESQVKATAKWSEADGDLVVLDDEADAKAHSADDVKGSTKGTGAAWSEADGDLVIIGDRKSHRLAFIEGEAEKSYAEHVEQLNADRSRKRPDSIRKTEKIVQARHSTRKQSAVAKDSEQLRSMQARLAQLQSKFDKDVNKMKNLLPKGFGPG